MKSRIVIASIAAVAMVVATLYAEDKAKLDGIKCPVSGKAVKEDKTVDYKGGKVYFCCENCPKAFTAEKHGVKANAQLVATGQYVQKACPLSGKDTDASTAVEVGGAKVAFCCNNCKGAVNKAEGDKKLEMVFADKAFDKAFVKAEKK